MQYRLLLSLTICLLCLGAQTRIASALSEASPATAPSTQPAGFSIQGTVAVEQSWTLQKTDLSRVAVYLASDPALDSKTVPVQVTMEQYRKAFDPDFLIVPRGSKVDFPNYDHFYHNVFSRSRIAPPFDLDRFDYGFSKSRQFDTPGVIHIFCNIHPQMHGMIVVTPNSIFARAGTEGRFQLPPVPAGHYTLVAWYERSGETRQDVTVSETIPSEQLKILLKENRQSVLANVPPDHGPAYGIERGLGIKRERLDLPVVKDAHPVPPGDHH
jgi:plastocyanin